MGNKKTRKVIDALESRRTLIEAAVAYRAPNSRKQRSAVRAFCKNNADAFGLDGINLSCQVDWQTVIEHFGSGPCEDAGAGRR